MKGTYKFGIVVLLLFTISTASAITQIGDNITVSNNVTAQNFLGNLNWAYLLGIPTDFPNSTLAGYNGNFPNSTVAGNLANWNATYNVTYDAKQNSLGTGTATQYLNGLLQWLTLSTTNITEGTNLWFTAARVRNNISATGNATFNQTTGVIDALTNITAVRSSISSSSGLVSYDSTTGVVSDSINSSANLYNMNASNVTSGKIPSVLRLPNGTVILLSGDEIQVTGFANNTAKTYSLSAANASLYSQIIAEAEVNITMNTISAVSVEWQFNLTDGTTLVDSFNLMHVDSAARNVKLAGVLKANFVEKTAQTISVSATSIGAASGMWGVRSLRVYGVV